VRMPLKDLDNFVLHADENVDLTLTRTSPILVRLRTATSSSKVSKTGIDIDVLFTRLPHSALVGYADAFSIVRIITTATSKHPIQEESERHQETETPPHQS
jgi:hypothetical protein